MPPSTAIGAASHRDSPTRMTTWLNSPPTASISLSSSGSLRSPARRSSLPSLGLDLGSSVSQHSAPQGMPFDAIQHSGNRSASCYNLSERYMTVRPESPQTPPIRSRSRELPLQRSGVMPQMQRGLNSSSSSENLRQGFNEKPNIYNHSLQSTILYPPTTLGTRTRTPPQMHQNASTHHRPNASFTGEHHVLKRVKESIVS